MEGKRSDLENRSQVGGKETEKFGTGAHTGGCLKEGSGWEWKWVADEEAGRRKIKGLR